jgi:hypothetical protein
LAPLSFQPFLPTKHCWGMTLEQYKCNERRAYVNGFTSWLMAVICATNDNMISEGWGKFGYLGFEPVASWSRRLKESGPNV